MSLIKKRSQKGAALVEYGLLVAGVALVASAAVAIFGQKTTDLIASIAAVLPGQDNDSNGPILSGKLLETTKSSAGAIEVDTPTILVNTNTDRLSTNLGVDVTLLVTETN